MALPIANICNTGFYGLHMQMKSVLVVTRYYKMLKRGGKGLVPKSESSKDFAVRTKIKYAKCMDPLLEGNKLQPGELENLCCTSTHNWS